jgi:bacillithiol disulfide reductase
MTRDVIIIGGGPAGLAAAIAAKQAGLDYLVLEKGVLVNSIYHFPPNMVFFTTPELLEIGGLPLVSPFEKPTRLEALRYYRRVVDTYDLQVSCGETVLTVDPDPMPGEDTHFAVETRSDRGVRRARHTRAVVLAIGYYDHPNLLNVPGEDLPHVSHYYTESHPFYRQRVVVVGGGNSAAESALDLFRSGAHVTLVHWRDTLKSTIKYWVRPDIENRIKEGSIPARFRTCVTEIRPSSVVVTSGGKEEELPADFVFLLTGYHPDNELFRRIGVELDPKTTAAVHDPDTFETNVRGVFVAGGAISGRDTSPIFIENGRFHGEKIVQALLRRRAD